MTKSGLGPHVVGQRVVVRRLVPGETGPTGGPAFTDTLGICESWGAEETVLRTEDGSEVRIPIDLIVSGKPVPPRPSRFRRLSDDEVDERCDDLRRAPRADHPVDVQLIGVARLARALAGTSGEVRVVEPAPGTLRTELDGTVAGITVHLDEEWALITDLEIDPDHRRRGSRRILVAALAEALAERGISVLVAEIPSEDVAARGLAEALGFERHHTTSGG